VIFELNLFSPFTSTYLAYVVSLWLTYFGLLWTRQRHRLRVCL